MSPVSFKQQIELFSTELARCISLCESIRMNQKFATTHTNFDRLQNALEAAEIKIPYEFSSIRKKSGPLFEYGDDIANTQLHTDIQVLQQTIKPKLTMLAQPGKPRDKHPGFSKMHSSFQGIQASILQNMGNLSLRIKDAAVPQPAPRPTHASATPSSKPASTTTPVGDKSKTKKSDELIITLKDLELLLEYKKNCWEEIFMGGRIAYVNCFDPKNLVWERPAGGFVKEVQRPSLSRKQSFERTSARRQSRSS